MLRTVLDQFQDPSERRLTIIVGDCNLKESRDISKYACPYPGQNTDLSSYDGTFETPVGCHCTSLDTILDISIWNRICSSVFIPKSGTDILEREGKVCGGYNGDHTTVQGNLQGAIFFGVDVESGSTMILQSPLGLFRVRICICVIAKSSIDIPLG